MTLLRISVFALLSTVGWSEEISREAKATLTPVEMNRGDVLKLKLRNGQTRTLVLEDTGARVLERAGGTLYSISCRVSVDGHAVTLERYIGSQETFYEPYVINGMRLWFDGVADAFTSHGGFLEEKDAEIGIYCKPNKAARFAMQDMTLPICPQELHPWYAHEGKVIDIANAYLGDDSWMGAYQGKQAHGGLDINMKAGSLLWAPMDLDDQFYFHSLAKGQNNNRWRGIRKWADGSTWWLQTHHLIDLLVPENKPLARDVRYATTAGVRVGAREHTHFVFRVFEGKESAFLDPWIIFWQILETEKAAKRQIHAGMKPLVPARTGHAVSFSAEGSRAGREANRLSYYWTFGDGSWSDLASPAYSFSRAGIYPVTVTVDNGNELAAFTQDVTVDGEPVVRPALVMTAPDEPSFRPRPLSALDAYGYPPARIPHTVEFIARASNADSIRKVVRLVNRGGGVLEKARRPVIQWIQGSGWLSVEAAGENNQQALTLVVRASGLRPGTYTATISIDCPGALNSPQSLRAQLRVPEGAAIGRVTVDDRDPQFYATPYFWVGHRFAYAREKGYRDFYLTNGGRAVPGEFARFTPDLRSGRYEVTLADETPFFRDPGMRFQIRVKHGSEEERVWVEPNKSRLIGHFDFTEGLDNFVEILADGSRGHVMADAIHFNSLDGR